MSIFGEDCSSPDNANHCDLFATEDQCSAQLDFPSVEATLKSDSCYSSLVTSISSNSLRNANSQDTNMIDMPIATRFDSPKNTQFDQGVTLEDKPMDDDSIIRSNTCDNSITINDDDDDDGDKDDELMITTKEDWMVASASSGRERKANFSSPIDQPIKVESSHQSPCLKSTTLQIAPPPVDETAILCGDTENHARCPQSESENSSEFSVLSRGENTSAIANVEAQQQIVPLQTLPQTESENVPLSTGSVPFWIDGNNLLIINDEAQNEPAPIETPKLDLGLGFLRRKPEKHISSSFSKDVLEKIRRYQENARPGSERNFDLCIENSLTAEPKELDDVDMNDDLEEENRAAEKRFADAKKRKLQKEAAGTLSIEDEIEFIRLEKQEKTRKQKLKQERWLMKKQPRNELEGPSNSGRLEISNRYISEDYENRNDEMHGAHIIDSQESPTGKTNPRKRKRPGQKEQENILNVGIEDDLEESNDKQKNGHAKWKENGRGRDLKRNQSKKKERPKKKGGGAKAKPLANKRGKPTSEMSNFDSLFVGNVFKDAATSADKPAPPGFHSTEKTEALKQLVASLPEQERAEASAQRQELMEASKVFIGFGVVKADGAGKWQLKGMRSSLEHFQLLGAAFMRRREDGPEQPLGGLCADQMGLGKTVMMIANIINGKQAVKKEKTTLIVATSALVTQWFNEFEKHCNPGAIGQILKYVAGRRLETNDTVNSLKQYDVILTTYHEVMRSYPKSKPPIELQTPAAKHAWWIEKFEKEKGVLHQIKFYRVVLDEAQVIKNHKSRSSRACRALQAKHRWALSGTAIMNNVHELYPYFKFLRVPNTGTLKLFKHNYRVNARGLERLKTMVSKFMMRRTHQSRLFNRPLLILPEATEKTVWVQFNDFERNVYEIVLRRILARIKAYTHLGELNKNYASIFTMMLRLRQLCGHILLVETVLQELLELEDHAKLRDLAEIEAENISETDREAQMRQLRKLMTSHDNDREFGKFGGGEPDAGNTCMSNKDISKSQQNSLGDNHSDSLFVPAEEMDNSMKTGGKHGLRYDFRKYLKSLQEGNEWEELQSRTLCAYCLQPPEDACVTSCYHIYCKECLDVIAVAAAKRDQDRAHCIACGTAYRDSKPCDASLFQGGSFTDPGSPEDGMAPKPRKRRSRESVEENCIKKWIEMDGSILPSAKTRAVKAQVLNWIEEDAQVKILVFTQFLAMIHILSRVCNQEGWKHCQYHGKMSQDARHNAIKEFSDNGTVRILLISLKCGGVGLNLMAASKVICIDPWWNYAQEEQAFCRVFRYNQVLPTQLTRIVVSNTIDERIVRMQERKQREIDAVMGKNGKRKKLSIQDLVRLFGEGDEENDDPFIFPNEETYGMDSESSGEEDMTEFPMADE